MKKLWWFSRLLTISAALYCILLGGNFFQEPARADPPGYCNTDKSCARDPTDNTCFCSRVTAGDCTGCYTPSGGTGCGKCAKSAGGGTGGGGGVGVGGGDSEGCTSDWDCSSGGSCNQSSGECEYPWID
jgi:hypothetical protein